MDVAGPWAAPPHVCARLLLEFLGPLWSEASLARRDLTADAADASAFLLETIDGRGDTPLHAALRLRDPPNAMPPNRLVSTADFLARPPRGRRPRLG